jgi:hypothetical protein
MPPAKMLTFFDPSTICRALAGTPTGTWNEAVLFHESLHGLTGQFDSGLKTAFGIAQNSDSEAISDYLELNVLGGGAATCGN